jgi:hypothetical protein
MNGARLWQLSAGAALLLLAACSKAPEEQFKTVTVNGTVGMIAGPMPAGTLHFRLYNLEALDGDLQHPLEEIEDFTSDTPEYSHTFEYPVHKGSGLAVHAWLDMDGDGVLCTPADKLEPSGLAYTPENPEETVTLDIALAGNCRAANYFYPPAP